MINKGEEFKELVLLVEKFMEIANELKKHGKIDEQQYTHITKNKLEFLRESREILE